VELTPEEVRVVGSLVEKELTTPQHYPLTRNALVAACNQTSNRNPVVALDEATVEAALTSLRERGLCRIVHSRSNRAAKYRHVLDEAWRLERDEVAVLAVLLLRGPQTPGELRSRTERMDTGDVESALDALAAKPEPLVRRLERQPGQKEARWAHLVSGEPQLVDSAPTRTQTRVAELEDEVERLRAEVVELRRRLGEEPVST
jgi:uncharacterized protein YceH (UPF0502 family)